MLRSEWVGPAAAIWVLASSDRVTWYTVELVSVAKHFSLFQNHSLSWAKLQNVTALHCADCSGQIVDMTAMQRLKASEEGCPNPVLLRNWLLYFQAKVKFHKKWNTDIKITSQLKFAISIGNSMWKKIVQGMYKIKHFTKS